jgi:hypothetical protein
MKENSTSMKIAIAGPGRSGTSLLVQILAAWGFSVPDEAHNWHDSANAGLESRLGSESPFDVDKDPWAYQYLDELSDEQISKYSVLIVPIRNLELAATSRLVLDRASRQDDGENQYWRWNDWGTVPGGAVYSTNPVDQGRILASGLWRLLDVASSRGMRILIISFPRFAKDFEYLWTEVSPYIQGRIIKSAANQVFDSIVDPSRIRTLNYKTELTREEAIGLLDVKSKSIASLSKEKLHLESLYAEKSKELQALSDMKNQEIEELKNTLSWRITLPLRKLRKILRITGN